MVTDETEYVRAGTMLGVALLVRDLATAIGDGDRRPALDAPRPSSPAPCRQ
jgi:hypothetical protein